MENYQIHGVINRAAAGQNGKWEMENGKREADGFTSIWAPKNRI